MQMYYHCLNFIIIHQKKKKRKEEKKQADVQEVNKDISLLQLTRKLHS